MCTFLGTAGKINDKDINSEDVKKADITFLEGYLWDDGEPKKAFDKAINASNKVAMSLSDIFCVERHKKHFFDLVKNKLDIVFANEQEILSLINSKDFNDTISFAKEIKKNIIITRGDKGAVAISNNQVFECKAKENIQIKDLTGAGDLFAAGFLFGYSKDKSMEECGNYASIAAAEIISHYGARPLVKLSSLI